MTRWCDTGSHPGEEPTVYTMDVCAEVGHEPCQGIDRTIEGYEGKTYSASASVIE